MAHLILGVVLCCCHLLPVHAQEQWYGEYVFENDGINVTHTRSWVQKESLVVGREGDKIVAVYSITMNGEPLDLAERWIGHDLGNSIVFTYDRCLPLGGTNGIHRNSNVRSEGERKERDCTDQHEPGVPMLTLSYKPSSHHRQILVTRFQNFDPADDRIHVEGIEYFQRISTK